LDYAAKHSDLIFVTSPTGADPVPARASLAAHIANIKALARRYGREVFPLMRHAGLRTA